MNETNLYAYVEKHGQTATAKKLGLTQGSIWQMLKGGRDIIITENPDGTISAYEKKPIGKPKAA